MTVPDINYVFDLINDIETREYNNNKDWDPLQRDARAGERMRAWEKLLYWALDGIDVS